MLANKAGSKDAATKQHTMEPCRRNSEGTLSPLSRNIRSNRLWQTFRLTECPPSEKILWLRTDVSIEHRKRVVPMEQG